VAGNQVAVDDICIGPASRHPSMVTTIYTQTFDLVTSALTNTFATTVL
jgi:hypothetical protein